MTSFTESVVEQAALAWLEGLGYSSHGPGIAPPACRDEHGAGRDAPGAERFIAEAGA